MLLFSRWEIIEHLASQETEAVKQALSADLDHCM
jgi:hypothetical protein